MSTLPLPPAGWYPNPENTAEMRWWDGTAWSAHTVPPGAVPAPPAPTATATATARKIPTSTWVGGALAVIFGLSAASAGIGTFLAFVGLVAGITAVYTLITLRRSWARLPQSRPIAGGIAAGSLVLLLIGAGVSSASHPTPPSQAVSANQTVTPTPAASPTPAPTDQDEPLDPAVVVAAASGPAVAISDDSATSAKALDLLATIPVKGKAPATGYARTAEFGAAWLDVDGNKCDTRNDILLRDLTSPVQQGGCRILSGTLDNKYTGGTMAFVRGSTTSALVQIDHIVALQNAWATGAQQLTPAQRISLANDPLNLIAVDAKSNEQKSSGDAATWLPKNTSFRCEYVARQISVKATYGLWVTTAEHDAMARVLGGCTDQPAVSSSFTPKAPEPTPTVAPAPAPAPPAPAPAPAPPAPAPAPAPPAPAPAPAPDAYYQNCDAVRAAGKAPLYAGQPGYSRKLDRDGDGIACE
ncbi:DUF1524 domain-containing protein [Leifsonia sp. NPDC058194]|uniref:GmrSD restriction endonuclease domain-containing protein n=1 Tax=Leifsonia sp. NPDC058194 TaxID=3346374 RepID=UPI0036DCBA5D